MITGISIAAGLIAWVIAVLLWVFWDRAVPRLTTGLISGGAISMLGTPIGRQVHTWVTQADTHLAQWVGKWTGDIVLGLPALFVTGVLAADLVKKRVRSRTLLAAVGSPLLANTIPGPVGEFVSGVFGLLATAIGTGLGALFSLG